MCIYPMKLRGHRLAVVFTGPWTLQINVSDEVQTLLPKPHDGVNTQSPKLRKRDTRRRSSLPKSTEAQLHHTAKAPKS